MKVPSQAEQGHFNFLAEIELTIHTDNMYVKFLTHFFHSFFSALIVLREKSEFFTWLPPSARKKQIFPHCLLSTPAQLRAEHS